MKVLVLSHRHSLLPFAWRLRREGHEVQVSQVGAKEAYHRAWGGRFESFLVGVDRVSDKAASAVVEAATEADAVVVTDSIRWTSHFTGYPRLFGMYEAGTPRYSPLQLGAWFTGTQWELPHLLFDQVGVWPGGLGPQFPCATVLAQLRPEAPVAAYLGTYSDELKSAGFRGLARVPLVVEEGHLVPGGVQAGWPHLQVHAFVGELGALGTLLAGEPTALGYPYVAAVVVSVPPWPLRCNYRTTPTKVEVPREAMARCFFHDMEVRGNEVWTAGLDGLVAVARGAGHSAQVAVQGAVGVAGLVQVAEKQYRPDVGQAVPWAMERMQLDGLL